MYGINSNREVLGCKTCCGNGYESIQTELAKKLGATRTVNLKEENLKDVMKEIWNGRRI